MGDEPRRQIRRVGLRGLQAGRVGTLQSALWPAAASMSSSWRFKATCRSPDAGHYGIKALRKRTAPISGGRPRPSGHRPEGRAPFRLERVQADRNTARLVVPLRDRCFPEHDLRPGRVRSGRTCSSAARSRRGGSAARARRRRSAPAGGSRRRPDDDVARGTPWRTSSAATASARRCDRRWLYCGVPERSAWPATSIRVVCTRREFCAASAMIWRARSVRSARSQSKKTR